MSFVLRDLVGVAVLYYLSTFIDHEAVPVWARYILWPMYWWWQGNVMTGLWVLAHECGHCAFSPNEAFGHVVGMILHSVCCCCCCSFCCSSSCSSCSSCSCSC